MLVQTTSERTCSNCGNLGNWHNFALWWCCLWDCSESVALLWLWSTVCTLQWLPNLLITIILCPNNVRALKDHALWHEWFPRHAEGMMSKDRNILSCQAVVASDYVSCVIVKGWCLGAPRCTCLLLSALLVVVLRVQLHSQWFTATDVQIVQ